MRLGALGEDRAWAWPLVVFPEFGIFGQIRICFRVHIGLDLVGDSGPLVFANIIVGAATGAGTSNLPQYFKDISHNHVDISGSEVMGWFVMDKNVSDYNGYGGNTQARNDVIDWAKAAAIASGKVLTPYGNQIVVCLNRVLETYGGGSGAVLDNAGLEPGIAGQEMLHALGLLEHSRRLGQGDYTDPYGIMSAWTSSKPTTDLLYGRVGPILCAANMDFLGWLDHARVWQATGELKPTSIVLRPLARPDLQGYVAAKIGDYCRVSHE
jgi:hypothetical protein